MKTQVALTGVSSIPKNLRTEKTFSVQIVDSPYSIRDLAAQNETLAADPLVVVAYLPFLEMRNFDLYLHLQKKYSNLLILFVVQELSGTMKLKLKHNDNFIVLWKTEENRLIENIKSALEGRRIRLRQDRREPHKVKGIISPSSLPLGNSKQNFKPMLPGAFENLSEQGSCLKIHAPFYEPKDFVNLSYQTKQGDFVSIQGQVRWSRWNSEEQTQELGLHFVSST